jgi:hypothetical protein
MTSIPFGRATGLGTPNQPTVDNVYGLITIEGTPVVRGSHQCGKIGCTAPATVAVFGLLESNTAKLARLNVCPMHVAQAMGELADSWICALIWDRDTYGEACPHCGRQNRAPDGSGHLSVCPVGLSFPQFAARYRRRREAHDVGDCTVCSTYLNRRQGPTG